MGPMNIGIDLNLVKEKKQGPVSWVTRSSGKPAYREMLGFTGRDGIALRGALEAGGPWLQGAYPSRGLELTYL